MTTTTALKSLILAGGLALGLGATAMPTSAASLPQARAATTMVRSSSPVHVLSKVNGLHTEPLSLAWICPPPVAMGGAQTAAYYHPICPFQSQRGVIYASRSIVAQHRAGQTLVSAARLEPSTGGIEYGIVRETAE
jgi:hypothetical protein